MALVAMALIAAVFEQGIADGFKLVGGAVYAGCVMVLGFAAWRFLAQRHLCLTVVEWCVAVYAVTYALASLAIGWPIGFLTVLGLIIPAVILSVFSVFSRFGWW